MQNPVYRFVNIVSLIMIIFGKLHLSTCEKLQCNFKDSTYADINFYSCFVSSLEDKNNQSTIIDGFTGVQMANKNINDVKGIKIQSTSNKFIPANLGFLFNITVFAMWKTQLIEIKSIDFHGMQNLEVLSLWSNNLTSVPVNAFTLLTNLKSIVLGGNQIEVLWSHLFSNNLNLETMNLDNNRIKFIGSGLFNELKNLNEVQLYNNICINQKYNKPSLVQLKIAIKIKCFDPLEVQTEMEERIKNLEKQFTDALEHLRIVQQEKAKIVNERDATKKELAAAQDLLQKEKTTFELRDNEWNKKLLDSIIEQQQERKKNDELIKQIVEVNDKYLMLKTVVNEMKEKLIKVNKELANGCFDDRMSVY